MADEILSASRLKSGLPRPELVMKFTCGCAVTWLDNEKCKLTRCANHLSLGLAQIDGIPDGYIQTRWAVASDEEEPGKINAGVAIAVAEFPVIADYPGDDFYAYIWEKNSEFVGEVWIQKKRMSVEREASMLDLVGMIRKKYGQQ